MLLSKTGQIQGVGADSTSGEEMLGRWLEHSEGADLVHFCKRLAVIYPPITCSVCPLEFQPRHTLSLHAGLLVTLPQRLSISGQLFLILLLHG